MIANGYKPDPRIVPYLRVLNEEGPKPYVSYSWKTLAGLYQEHGELVIKRALDAHWKVMNAAQGSPEWTAAVAETEGEPA